MSLKLSTAFYKTRPAVYSIAFILAASLFTALSFYIMRPVSADSINTTDFVTTWKTDNPGTSNDTSITIPTDPDYTYNYDIDWDNDGLFDTFNQTGNATHDYGQAGEVTVRIRGTFPTILFQADSDYNKIIDVKQWGNIEWQTFEQSFYGTYNLSISATDAPDLSEVTNMSYMFSGAESLDGDFSAWDTSSITTMVAAFYGTVLFDGDVSSWNVSNVENMVNMFKDAGMTNDNYDKILNSWSTQTLKTGVMFHTNAQYCDGFAAHRMLENDLNWDIDDDGLSCEINIDNDRIDGQISENGAIGLLNTTDFVAGDEGVSYSINCHYPGSDDNLFKIGGVDGNELQAAQDIVYTSQGSSEYSVCVRATDDAVEGKYIDVELYVYVDEPVGAKNIDSVSFDPDYYFGTAMVVRGTSLLDKNDPADNPTTRSLVTLNGDELAFCSAGFPGGMSAADLAAMYNMDPTLVTDDSPCYMTVDFVSGGDPEVFNSSHATVLLPDGFDTEAEGTVSVNNSPVYTFNAETSDGNDGEGSVISPTVYINGKSFNSATTIAVKRPTFSGVAEPGSTVNITVRSEPVICETEADASGNWSCTLPSDLIPGDHTVTVLVTEPGGLVSELGPYSIRVPANSTTETTITDSTLGNNLLAPNAGFAKIEALKDRNNFQSRTVLAIAAIVAIFITASSALYLKKKHIL